MSVNVRSIPLLVYTCQQQASNLESPCLLHCIINQLGFLLPSSDRPGKKRSGSVPLCCVAIASACCYGRASVNKMRRMGWVRTRAGGSVHHRQEHLPPQLILINAKSLLFERPWLSATCPPSHPPIISLAAVMTENQVPFYCRPQASSSTPWLCRGKNCILAIFSTQVSEAFVWLLEKRKMQLVYCASFFYGGIMALDKIVWSRTFLYLLPRANSVF
jgi:hypothetical protein